MNSAGPIDHLHSFIVIRKGLLGSEFHLFHCHIRAFISFLFVFFLANSELNAQVKHDSLSVYFAPDSVRINNDNLKKITEFIKDSEEEITSVSILGYADTSGLKEKNIKLASNRASNTYKALVTNLNTGKIQVGEVSGKGPVQIFGTDLANNRKVLLIKEVKLKPSKTEHTENIEKGEAVYKNLNDTAGFKKGDRIVLENILFNNNSHVFLKESLPALKALTEMMKSYSDLKIEIQGHVCCGGDNPEYDMRDPQMPGLWISESRAKAVYDFLSRNGIAEERLKYAGYHFTRPLISPELTEEDRRKNRRVEIEIQ